MMPRMMAGIPPRRRTAVIEDFNNHCAQCHRPDLTGGPDVSPLVGGKFLSKWVSQKASDLIGFEHQNMPANNPGSVPMDQLYPHHRLYLGEERIPCGIDASFCRQQRSPAEEIRRYRGRAASADTSPAA